MDAGPDPRAGPGLLDLQTKRAGLGALFYGELISVNCRCCSRWAAVGLFLGATRAFPQGQITFNNRVNNVVIAPVYGVEAANPNLVRNGNTSSGTPVGTQTYSGSLLAGTGFTAQLFGGPT